MLPPLTFLTLTDTLCEIGVFDPDGNLMEKVIITGTNLTYDTTPGALPLPISGEVDRIEHVPGTSIIAYGALTDLPSVAELNTLNPNWFSPVEFHDLYKDIPGVTRIGTKADETWLGVAGDNSVIMGQGDDVYNGSTGNDTFKGGGGNDFFSGNDGDDRATGGGGNDQMIGGAGNDRLFGNKGDDQMNGGSGADLMNGGAGNDTMAGDDLSDPGLASVNNDDRMFGRDGDDLMFGVVGNDKLYGGNDNDYLSGGDDNDRLDGGDGNDYLQGDEGIDLLTGGSGADTFVFRERALVTDGAGNPIELSGDTVTDFDPTEDRIHLSQRDQSATAAENFAYFTAHAVQDGNDVRWTADHGFMYIVLEDTLLSDLSVANFVDTVPF